MNAHICYGSLPVSVHRRRWFSFCGYDMATGAGILTQVTVGRRNRAFEAPAIINAFTDLERQLASHPLGEYAP